MPLCIAPDKSRYPHNIFLISPQKRILWVLIRSLDEALLMSTHSICFREEIRKYQFFLDKKSTFSESLHIVMMNIN